MKVVIIPARLAAHRFPNKPLIDIAGKPLLRWTYDAAAETTADLVLVATSDEDIIWYCKAHGLKHVITENAPTGTHRCALAIDQIRYILPHDIIVNWQVDEPAVKSADVDRLFESAEIGTLLAPVAGETQHANDVRAAVVQGRCHWFSRTPMPGGYHHHVGIYSYSVEELRALGQLEPTQNSLDHSLEQLAWIEAGRRIIPTFIDYIPLAINSPSDASIFERLIV